jgi:hypothetical protein
MKLALFNWADLPFSGSVSCGLMREETLQKMMSFQGTRSRRKLHNKGSKDGEIRDNEGSLLFPSCKCVAL